MSFQDIKSLNWIGYFKITDKIKEANFWSHKINESWFVKHDKTPIVPPIIPGLPASTPGPFGSPSDYITGDKFGTIMFNEEIGRIIKKFYTTISTKLDTLKFYGHNLLPYIFESDNFLRYEAFTQYLSAVMDEMHYRDHFVHPFIVTMLGMFFIESHGLIKKEPEKSLLNYLSESYSGKTIIKNTSSLYNIFENENVVEGINRQLEPGEAESILKLSWILTGLFHDIGYYILLQKIIQDQNIHHSKLVPVFKSLPFTSCYTRKGTDGCTPCDKQFPIPDIKDKYIKFIKDNIGEEVSQIVESFFNGLVDIPTPGWYYEGKNFNSLLKKHPIASSYELFIWGYLYGKQIDKTGDGNIDFCSCLLSSSLNVLLHLKDFYSGTKFKKYFSSVEYPLAFLLIVCDEFQENLRIMFKEPKLRKNKILIGRELSRIIFPLKPNVDVERKKRSKRNEMSFLGPFKDRILDKFIELGRPVFLVSDERQKRKKDASTEMDTCAEVNNYFKKEFEDGNFPVYFQIAKIKDK